jgi:hypothetical protein
MNTEAEYSILDAVANIHRLDRSFWDGIVAHGPGGVDIVRSPNLLGVDDADVRKIQHVLTLIRTFYHWTVLDLGRMTGLSLSLLDKVNDGSFRHDLLFRSGNNICVNRCSIHCASETNGCSRSVIGQSSGIGHTAVEAR